MTVTTSYKLETVGNLSKRVLSADASDFDLASNAAGTVLLTAGTNDFSEVDGTITDTSGATVAGPFPIASENNNFGLSSSTALADGSFVTAFLSVNKSTQEVAFKMQRTTATGVLRGTRFGLDDTAQYQALADITGLRNGGFVVTWTDEKLVSDGIEAHARYEVFRADGTKAPSGALDADSSFQTAYSSVAGLKNGSFVVAFTEAPSFGAGSHETLVFQRYDADGATVGDKVVVDPYGSKADEAHAIGLADGGFALAYRSDEWTQDGNADITLVLYDANGALRGSYQEVNRGQAVDDTADNQEAPSITQLANGLIAVSWESPQGSGFDVNARLYDARGHAVTDVTRIGHTASNNLSTALASQLLGTFTAGWIDRNDASDLDEVHGGQVNLVRLLTGTNTAEVINGNNGIDRVSAGGGNDKVYLGGGDDKANGGLGNDLIRGGDGNDRMLGAAGFDKLYGDAGNDVLDGGTGHDLLTGGSGRDTFVFDHAPGGANLQTITDFAVGVDTMLLDAKLFGKAFGAKVDASEFRPGAAATTTREHLLYDGNTGALFYDADGSGKGAKMELAELGKHLQLSYRDFAIGQFAL